MLQINWSVVAFFFIAFFALSGFSRGWWKEAVTTIFMAILIFFLQNPELAQEFIDAINTGMGWLWDLMQKLPVSIFTPINDFFLNILGINIAVEPLQFQASVPGTWLTLLALFVVVAVLIGRLSFKHEPTGVGKLLGTLMGAVNGFLILSIGREYLDGRALPGQSTSTSEVTLVGGSDFGAASESVALEIAGLPDLTILDSIIPWILMGIGLVFLFSVLKTRVAVDINPKGRKIQTRLPPFYKVPAKGPGIPANPPVTPVRIVE